MSQEERQAWAVKNAKTPKWYKPAMTGLSVIYACAGLAVLIFAKHPDTVTRSVGALFVTIAALDVWGVYRKRKTKSIPST